MSNVQELGCRRFGFVGALALLLALWALSALALLALCSCGLMSPAQQASALAVLEQMRQAGTITREQFESLQQALLGAGQAQFWEQVVTAVSGAALGYAGVRISRGPANKQRAKRDEGS